MRRYDQEFLLIIGHGRALELYLCVFKIALGVWILAEDAAGTVPTLADLRWYYPSATLAAPFFLVGGLQFSGWVMNWAGLECSWAFRAAGALLAITMWFWMVFKTEFAGETSPLFVVAIVSVPFSVIIFYKAWNRLPVPGAPGLV